MHQDFAIKNEYIALNDLLKVCGVVDSGGAGKMLVAAGEISVDGAVELRKTCKIRPRPNRDRRGLFDWCGGRVCRCLSRLPRCPP